MRYFIFMSVLLFAYCKQKEVKPMEITGKYSVHLELDQKQFNKQTVKDSIAQAMSKAKEDLAKAKIEVDASMDTSFIDTSSFEGKMEYFAKSFAKSMASFGKDLGEMGILLGEAAGDVAAGAMDFTESLLQKIKLEIELQENGQVVTSSALANDIQFIGTHWEVAGDTLTFKDNNGMKVQAYQVADLTPNGFQLLHNKYKLVFVRKQNQ